MTTEALTHYTNTALPVQSMSDLHALDKIAGAFAKAQGELTNPPKTKTANAGKYTYSYADLAEIIDHVRPVLTRNSLAVAQMIEAHGETNLLVTRLIHESGQYLESTYPLPQKAAAQDMGSAITYARRYSLCAILGIAAEADDDGAKAQESRTNRAPIMASQAQRRAVATTKPAPAASHADDIIEPGRCPIGGPEYEGREWHSLTTEELEMAQASDDDRLMYEHRERIAIVLADRADATRDADEGDN